MDTPYKVQHSVGDGRYHLYSRYGLPGFSTDGTDGTREATQRLADTLNVLFAEGYAAAQEDIRTALGIEKCQKP